MATPTGKNWKNLSVDQKDRRRPSVGQADFFQNRLKKTTGSLNMSTACLCKKIDAHACSDDALTRKCTKTKRTH